MDRTDNCSKGIKLQAVHTSVQPASGTPQTPSAAHKEMRQLRQPRNGIMETLIVLLIPFHSWSVVTGSTLVLQGENWPWAVWMASSFLYFLCSSQALKEPFPPSSSCGLTMVHSVPPGFCLHRSPVQDRALLHPWVLPVVQGGWDDSGSVFVVIVLITCEAAAAAAPCPWFRSHHFHLSLWVWPQLTQHGGGFPQKCP